MPRHKKRLPNSTRKEKKVRQASDEGKKKDWGGKDSTVWGELAGDRKGPRHSKRRMEGPKKESVTAFYEKGRGLEKGGDRIAADGPQKRKEKKRVQRGRHWYAARRWKKKMPGRAQRKGEGARCKATPILKRKKRWEEQGTEAARIPLEKFITFKSSCGGEFYSLIGRWDDDGIT